jgi:hypothetical protein
LLTVPKKVQAPKAWQALCAAPRKAFVTVMGSLEFFFFRDQTRRGARFVGQAVR